MKHPRRWLLIGSITTATVGVIVLVLTTPLVSNALLLLMERSNSIPAESSILTFEPYAINDGSSNYWLYGKDRTYYYHFTYEDDAPYVYIPQDNRCPGFDRQNARTWCSALPGKARWRGGGATGVTTKTLPFGSVLLESGAGNETRTRDLNLGKVALYQLSYSRRFRSTCVEGALLCRYCCTASTGIFGRIVGRRSGPGPGPQVRRPRRTSRNRATFSLMRPWIMIKVS